jgi:hypothetical protein
VKDLILDARSGKNDFRMALAYVSLFKKISATSRERFLVDFPEIVSAIGHFPGLSKADCGDRLYDLFQRHAQSVEDVITEATTKHIAALFRNEMPSTSLLAACFSRRQVELAPPSNYDAQAKAFMDNLSAPILEFAVDEEAKCIVFRGGFALDGASFNFVAALIEDFRAAKKQRNDGTFRRTPDLADDLDISESSVRQQLKRLRKAIEPLTVSLGIPLDQDTFIQTQERDGYRINPQWRELAVADIFGPAR